MISFKIHDMKDNGTFLKMPKILTKDELLDKAFSHARKVSKTINPYDRIGSIREYEQNKINTSATIITEYLTKVLKETPQIPELDQFYQELVGLLIDIRQFRKSMGALSWAHDFITSLEIQYRKRLRGTPLKSLSAVRGEFYGRLSSAMKQIKTDLTFLEDARIRLKKLPAIKDLPTIVIAGYPNVGKSSLLKSLTGAEPDIQPYPFTTKNLLIGYVDDKIQIIDTPGLLDRPDDLRNPIEKRSLVALEHKANLILFLLDPTETCGYKFDKQLSLYSEIKDTFGKTPIVVCMTKSDMPEAQRQLPKNLAPVLHISTKTGAGIIELRKSLLKSIDWKTFQFRINMIS